MFPSFTGSARPRRQVNLSGRNTNPFAAVSGSRLPSSSQTAQNALAQAQHERLMRQQERIRPPAATAIQRIWRGHKAREEARNRWRREWDFREAQDQENGSGGSGLGLLPDPYKSEQHCLGQLRLLVQFASPKDQEDIGRLHLFAIRYLESLRTLPSAYSADTWTYPLLRLAKIVIATLKQSTISALSPTISSDLLKLLVSLAGAIPEQLSSYSVQYYQALAALITSHGLASNKQYDQGLLGSAALGLMQSITARTITVYESFAREFLILPDLPMVFGNLKVLEDGLNYKVLATALNNLLHPVSGKSLVELRNRQELLWLLAYFIHFRRCAYNLDGTSPETPDSLYINVVSKLISYLADDIGMRVDTSQVLSLVEDDAPESTHRPVAPLPCFVRDEILTLVSQKSVSSLLAHLEIAPANVHKVSDTSSQASSLASYALTLLRTFPTKRVDICMWLYRGSTFRQSGDKLPAIKYFYQASRATKIYSLIKKDPREAIALLRADTARKPSGRFGPQLTSDPLPSESRNQQWRVILLFLELYTVILRLMDDEEFLSGNSPSNTMQSWTRQSALPLDQVEDLTVFLKNLAFTMYWNTTEIAGVEEPETQNSLAEYFSGKIGTAAESRQDQLSTKVEGTVIGGVSGMTLGYTKGIVTGLLRMIYERDSRRKFLPNDHWLMTKWFEMDKFISAVVVEEEQKHKIEESYGEGAEEGQMDEDEEDETENVNLVGTSRTQQVRNIERLKRQQRKASRRKYLESVTPRLEILQNMPFFIPFATRVQIFRKFVTLDQIRRRGSADADEWRFRMMNSGPSGGDMSRHRAKVRRENIFDDAYEQFFQLGEGLKEPIQIRFVDKFDTVEEGIDGGGVTKEFLTSVTSEAFSPNSGLNLFVENDQHLLYPNPSAVEEREDLLQQAGVKRGSAEWNQSIRDLLQRYEFLGRIVGKCLYEGILVDIHFAGFFLLKWALTGGNGSATKESGYRSNLNDIRDLDESLFQGLLQLKNYPGNVEDFSLDFTVTDTLSSTTPTKTITHNLRPNGAQISVTNANRLIYIADLARHRLQIQPWKQTHAFMQGLGKIISPSWLSMFNQNELQTLIGGDSSEIDIADLRKNTQYGGVYAIGDDGLEHPSVRLFWRAMKSFSDVDRRKVLKFVTSTPRAPLLGFNQLNPRFSIRDSGNDQTRLPSTSTCVNLLKLPIYSNVETLKDRLLYSINAGAGFNLS